MTHERLAMSLLTIAVTLLAVAGALAANRLVWRPRQARDTGRQDGLSTTEIAVPLVTLATVLLVFVLVQVFSSWSNAGRAETEDATATLLLFREAELLADQSVREAMRPQVVCYATSVVEQDWPAMGDGRISNVPTYWGDLIRRATLLLIRDFDQPYRGLTGRAPEQTRFIRDLLRAEVRGPLPCDARGLPAGDPSFRVRTSPLR